MKRKILLTGTTGNIGQAVLKYINTSIVDVFAGVRNPKKTTFDNGPFKAVGFDFETQRGLELLDQVDTLFLLRPPQLADVNKYFKPILEKAKSANLKHIVFLSVQGAQSSEVIPHRKIEKLVMALDLPYTFIRPGYFMQNLNTTLYEELKVNHRIYMPSKKLKFNWTDVDDIGRVIAQVIEEGEKHFGQTYEITGDEQLSFGEVVERMNHYLGTQYYFKSPNVIYYCLYSLLKGSHFSYLAVMLLLHFLPRFQNQLDLTETYNELTGIAPRKLEHYFKEYGLE